MNVVPIADVDPAAIRRLCERALVHELDAARLPALIERRGHVGLVALDDEGDGAPMGVCFVSGAGTDGFVDLIAVDPDRRRRRVASQLLWDAEYALREELGCTIVRATGHPPFYAWPGVDVRYTAALGLFEWHGYHRSGEVVNMSISLEGLDLDVELPPGLEIRRARPQDGPALTDAIARSWTEDDWSAEIAAAFEIEDAGVHLAVENGAIVGFAVYGITHPNVGGPIGVWPQARGRDVGLALMKRCMSDVRDSGILAGEFLWVGPIAYFSKHVGATINRVFWIYEKPLG